MTAGRIAISEITTAAWSFEEDVQAYGETAGVGGIGVWREKLAASEYSPTEARERLDRAGLKACSLLFAGGFTEDFEAGLADAREAIRTAETLGAPVLLVVAGPRIGVSPREGERLAREALEELAPEAREAGVTLALEPIHPIRIAEYSTVVTLAEAHEVIANVDGAGLMLDVWNSWWEPDLVGELKRAADEIAAVQIADFRTGEDPLDRAPPGEGIAPLGEIVATLEGAGYEGWYEVELFTEQYEPAAYPELIESCVSGTEAVLSEANTR